MSDQTVLICGESTKGKSASLRDLKDPEGVVYMNLEAGKRLPFKSKFKEITITDPLNVLSLLDQVEEPAGAKFHTVVLDGTNFMMDMFESIHVIPAADTQKAWGQYGQFFKTLMQQKVARSTKNIIFTGHTFRMLNTESHVMEVKVPVKGALAKAGIEAFFTTIVAAKQVPISKLEDFQNDLLKITPLEESLGVKNVFQTQITADTVNERIRAPMGMWRPEETYIDNSAAAVMQRLNEYYG